MPGAEDPSRAPSAHLEGAGGVPGGSALSPRPSCPQPLGPCSAFSLHPWPGQPLLHSLLSWTCTSSRTLGLSQVSSDLFLVTHFNL